MSAAPTLPGFPAPEPLPFEPWIPYPRRAIRDPQLTDLDRKVLALIVDLTGDRRDFTTVANETIAEELGIDRASVRRCLIRLEAAGYLNRHRERLAGSRRRIDLAYRTWDPPKKECASAPCTKAQSAPAHAKECASARHGVRQRTLPYHIGFEKDSKPSKSETTLPLPENRPEGGAPTTLGAEEVAPRAEAHQAETPQPPSPKEIADYHAWIAEGQPLLVRIAQRALAEAGLPVPDPPARPAQADPSDAEPGPEERTRDSDAAPEAARTTQGGPRPTEDAPDGESTHEPARAQPGPRQGPPPRHPADEIPTLAAVNWSAMMQRCTQAGPRGPKNLVGENFLRLWVETGESIHLDATLNAWSAHWRDWKRESREHWASCVGEIRTGLVTIDEILSIVDDAERRQVTKRAHYFSHHVGDMLRLKRAQKTAPPGCS